jgi:hypothetical protein
MHVDASAAVCLSLAVHAQDTIGLSMLMPALCACHQGAKAAVKSEACDIHKPLLYWFH